MSLALNVKELNELIANRRLVEGIERYYADDVVMSESLTQSMTGKDANLERERAFEGGLTRWDAKLHSSVVDETDGTAMNEWTIDFDHAAWGPGKMQQVAVQRWRDGRIVQESFYKLA